MQNANKEELQQKIGEAKILSRIIDGYNKFPEFKYAMICFHDTFIKSIQNGMFIEFIEKFMEVAEYIEQKEVKGKTIH